MFDAHSHFPSPDAILCSSNLEIPLEPALARGIGLLPQYLSDGTVEKLEDLLFHSEDFFIGEVGLDRRFIDRVPLLRQIEELRKILQAARQLSRPVTLHCVRADGHMVCVIKEFPDVKFLWHGFNGSLETGEELLGLGVLVSVRPGFGEGARALLAAHPDRILVESDYTGADAHLYNEILASNYEEAAKAAGIKPEQLEENACALGKVFTHKQIHR